MSSNFDGPQYLRAGADIDMTANFGDARSIPATQRDLMEDQAVHANPGIRMDDDSVWMRDQQAAANLARQRDIGARNDCPKPVWQHEQLAIKDRDKTGLLAPGLVFADGTQQLSSGIPELTRFLPAPIGYLCTNSSQELIHPGSSFALWSSARRTLEGFLALDRTRSNGCATRSEAWLRVMLGRSAEARRVPGTDVTINHVS